MNLLAKNLLILASAGSGKTFQLANRVIGLVASGVDPKRIVALTFTRKAAGEFADSVLTKLAAAAGDARTAATLRETLGLPAADFTEALERVVRALPTFTLGTMDGFFARIVRNFQYELGLTGGKFELIEGTRAQALTDELLIEILGDTLTNKEGEEFFHAFRRATIGKEDQGVLNALRSFVTRWQVRYQEGRHLDWGPAKMAAAKTEDWENQKAALAALALRGLDHIQYTRSGQREALEKEILNLQNHVIGGGSLGSKTSALMAGILEAAASPGESLTVKFYKEFIITGPTAGALRDMVGLAAQCEFAAALTRTRAIREVVASFDNLSAKRLRHKGMLGFNDVKLLMGAWAESEDARLRREAVDFRLDGRTDHWLLDEFQDTSRADWMGLQPLIDEAAADADSSVFIVGDRKQAIYAWRGGDVGLFDEVIRRYGTGIEIESMAESWRSCPEVLALVNQVCGDTTTLRELFGAAAANWEWQDHFSAAPLKTPGKRGHARVEVVGTWDERLERMVGILRELGIGQRAMTCGILLRGNNQAREVTDYLRAAGFDVIEEGRREPAKDNPVGIVISNLLQWLSNPSDSFAREVVVMSPIQLILQEAYGQPWWKIWEGLTHQIATVGFAATISNLLDECSSGWSEFGQRRAGDLIAALSALDDEGVLSPGEAADRIKRLQVSQSPGIAAIQVMTIHKAKGLGFDVVLLPEIPDENVPQPQYFEVAETADWLTQTPPKWARSIIPELKEAENIWATRQRYEAFCMLYVALTRSKRGLYVLLDPPAKSSAPDKASLANWLGRAVATDGTNDIAYESGSMIWKDSISTTETTPRRNSSPILDHSAPRRGAITATSAKTGINSRIHSPAAMKFGTHVHELLEKVAWLDVSAVNFPPTETGRFVANLLRRSNIRAIFEKQNRNIELHREQPADSMIGGNILSGVIDRLHLHRDSKDRVTRVEIIDFKTDTVKSALELRDRYAGQMSAYRNIMERLFPGAEIDCLLLSVTHGEIVKI